MIELKGKYNTAKIFTDNVEKEAQSQIIQLLNLDIFANEKIRAMPDIHLGKGCTIGFTSTLINNKIIPNLVGVDIGCGMYVVNLGNRYIDLALLDQIINDYIPSGKNIHKNVQRYFDDLQYLCCIDHIKDVGYIQKSVGSLGGGNHFIEVAKDSQENVYIIIHSGSRNLGKQVAEYYQQLAINALSGKEDFIKEKNALIERHKKLKIEKNIHHDLKMLEVEFNSRQPNYPKDLCYLEGENSAKYLLDMDICQRYANKNRETIFDIIAHKMNWREENLQGYFTTVHNYIDVKNKIIRKGAVSAQKDETLLIPMNMRDGSLLCKGKGNSDWNYSAPHGAGRLYSRTKAKEVISLDSYKETMKDIYTTSVGQSTLDEAPDAYKPMDEIINNIGDTVEVLDILKPIYNFKASE